MANRLPKFSDKHKICIICEGNEEYEYLRRLNGLKVWNEKYDIMLVNASFIKKYTGIENYKGRADQVKGIMEHITIGNYKDMCQRVKRLNTIDHVTGSSNFGKFIDLFENGDSGWIDEINNSLE